MFPVLLIFLYFTFFCSLFLHLQIYSSFAHLSSSIAIHKELKENKAEEFQKYFPHFLWLLRDVINLPYDEEGEEIELVNYLYTTILVTTGQNDCDNVVKAIRTLFPQPLSCEYLPPPTDNDEFFQRIENEDELEEFFVERASEVIDGMKQSISPKMGFDRKTQITGPELAVLAQTYLTAINQKGSVPSLEQGWMAVIKLKLSELAKKLVVEYEKEMEMKLHEKLPMELHSEESDEDVATLMGIHKEIFEQKQQALVEEIHRLLPSSSEDKTSGTSTEKSKERDAVLSSFQRDIAMEEGGEVKAGSLLRFTTDNYKASETQCEELWSTLFKEKKIQEQSAKAMNQSDAVICNEVCENIQLLREEYNSKAVGPAREAVRSRKAEEVEGLEQVLQNIPGPPVNLRVVGKSKNAIKLRWDSPEINAEAAKKYKVQMRKGDGEWKEDGTTEKQWYMVKKLKANSSYEFRVASWNDEQERLRGEIEKGLKTGTRLGKLARLALSAIGFIGGTAAAPILSAAGVPALAHDSLSTSKAKAAAAFATAPVTVPLLATLGAPIVGGKVAYHVYNETGSWGELAEEGDEQS